MARLVMTFTSFNIYALPLEEQSKVCHGNGHIGVGGERSDVVHPAVLHKTKWRYNELQLLYLQNYLLSSQTRNSWHYSNRIFFSKIRSYGDTRRGGRDITSLLSSMTSSEVGRIKSEIASQLNKCSSATVV